MIKFLRCQKLSALSLFGLIILTCMSLLAEVIANSKPVLLNYQGKIYCPILVRYPPSIFNKATTEMNYRELILSKTDWAMWPPVAWDPYERNASVASYPSPPSKQNWLGTDDRGRDIFARLLYGYRYSMGYAVMVWLLISLFGALFGAAMGYFTGWVDLLGGRAIEVMESLPWLLILVTVVAIYQPSFWLLVFFSTLFGWVGISLYFRAEFLRLRKLDFVIAAQAVGAGPWRILSQHIFPNSLTPWLCLSPFLITAYISQLAALDYLGFGLRAPTPSWGELLYEAQQNFTYAWWLAVFPSLTIFLVLCMLSFIGEGIRDHLQYRKTPN